MTVAQHEREELDELYADFAAAGLMPLWAQRDDLRHVTSGRATADRVSGVGGPGGQQAQAVVRGRSRLGGPDDDLQVRVGGPGDRVPVQVQVADDGMAKMLDPCAPRGDVLGDQLRCRPRRSSWIPTYGFRR
jgi:hypothetical protein